ncbi:MAG: SufD family Fe-S cluster assembly protein, partial [Blastocatellia bacterium]
MSGVKEKENLYVADFERLARQTGTPAWLASTRESAFQRFLALGFPTTRLEDWKYTNVAPIAAAPFSAAPADLKSVEASAIDAAILGDMGCPRVVVVDGSYAGLIGGKAVDNAGLRVGSLAKLVAEEDRVVRENLSSYADYDNHAFVALNTAFVSDGVVLQIPDRVVVEEPIYLLFVSTGSRVNTISHPRALIVAGRDCQATVIQGFIGLGDEVYFTNAVTEVVVGENSHINHFNLQAESSRAYHVATLQISQARSSSLHTHSIALG